MWSPVVRAVHLVAGRVPPAVSRRLGRLPLLRPLLGGAAGALASEEVTIPRGAARGLRFCAGSANWPGYSVGATEPLVQETLTRHLKFGDVFYDIGANVGFFTLIGARVVGPSGAVCAFEPHPETAAVLRRNVASNAFDHVAVLEVAVGASSGTAKIAGSEPLAFHFADDGIEVRVATLDDLVAELRPPTLMKIDVEGAEVDVLRGARRTLAEHAPAIICEVHGEDRTCAQLLVGLGYRVAELDRDDRGISHVLAVRGNEP